MRQEQKWTQAELGQKLGLKDSAISKYESGSLQLSGDLLIQLADIFGVSTDFILGRTKYRHYENTSHEPGSIVDMLSRGDLSLIAGYANLSEAGKARLADYVQVLQKAEEAEQLLKSKENTQ